MRWAFSREKVIISGDIVEIYQYKNPIKYKIKTDVNKKAVRPKNITEGEQKAINKRISTTRARNTIRRLANVNFGNPYDKFITLTFADNIQDLNYANREFKKFIQKLRYWLGNFKYLAVMEKQKRGAIHYHILCDYQPKIDQTDLFEKWGHGFVEISAVCDGDIDNVGAYLIKYVSKDLSLAENCQKNYLCSKGLERPQIEYGIPAASIRNALNKEEKAYVSSYDSVFNGKVTFKEYNLLRNSRRGEEN